jgi:hypothetical protein
MTTVIALIMLACFLGALVVGILYFQDLSAFGSALEADHPNMIQNVRTRGILPISRSKAAYKILSRVKGGAYQGIPLSNTAMEKYSGAKRLLYIYMVLFLALIAIFLTLSAVDYGPQA